MSVIRTTDEKLDEVKKHITFAYQKILIVLDNETWGHDESYIDSLREIALKLLEIKRKL